mmetsp:Transcript_47960/g.144938  ORF Transcript_47960/g.144938 Transcript_47960/m.144938 type:complete len:86 (-) Transcript_47960:452-709(-)|eukprot:CAMPEP_0113553148 /NCGR_PEP_ID=MMETSP0015_2-20120614/15453_1 /TAXON_ID=2838 /ORGANISM="Odontella" /LENGTH=85 /DNA_ID=CAMNT_0000454187 /DNA_START=328 /DNA_END=585 /DNA_ORIENTATION=- /assembly_acc=CAM_ASM_000160
MRRELSGEASGKGWGFFLLTLAILSLLYIVFLCYRRFRAKRDEEEQRAQVDVVLEDMVGNEAVEDSDMESVADDTKNEEEERDLV